MSLKKYTVEDLKNFEVVGGKKMCPSGDYSCVKSFGKRCSFGESSSFGKMCSFGESSSWLFWSVSILRANLGEVSEKICCELMNRDRDSHPHPELFESWTNGDECPYSGAVERKHFFDEKKKYYNPGAERINDRDLIILICKEKKWSIKY